MAKRPIRIKQANRLRKAISRQPLPAYVDLVEWLKLRGYADTTGQAEKIILDGRVRSESHVLGITKGLRPKPGANYKVMLGRPLDKDDYDEVDVVQRRIPEERARALEVLPA